MCVVIFLTGCANRPLENGPAGVAFVVPGVSGDGESYNALRTHLSRAGFGVRTHSWGAPAALFALNFSTKSIHDKAERSLAEKINALPPDVRVIVIGHSAGGGVSLGAVKKLRHRSVDTIVLLSPSTSPGYDLSSALARSNTIHNFFSERDITFLKWRTGNFGTYDRIKTPAAGHAGFTTTDQQLSQHAYRKSWRQLGNNGGHWGTLADEFIEREVLPLVVSPHPTDSESVASIR